MIRELDLTDFPSSYQSCDFILLPTLDCGRVCEQAVEVIETEEANADEDGDAARIVEDEEEDLRSRWIARE